MNTRENVEAIREEWDTRAVAMMARQPEPQR